MLKPFPNSSRFNQSRLDTIIFCNWN